MPLLSSIGTPILLSSLAGVGLVGISTPTLAKAIATALVSWGQSRSVSTVDVGTVGVGVGFLPLIVPLPSFYAALLSQAKAQGMDGVFTPLFLAGLSQGTTAFLANGIIATQHPSVGVGTAIATVGGPPSPPICLQAFASLGLTGETSLRLARVLGFSLDAVIPSTPYPLPIVGSPSPTSTGGSGVGSVLLWV